MSDSESDDIMCLSLKPGLPKIWDMRKFIRSYVQIAISRGEETKLDDLVKHIARIYDGNQRGNENYMRQLGDAFRRFELEQAKNADQLKASKPLEKNGNLTENDLMTLNDREWLNDSVINEYLKLILKSSERENIVVLSSFFVEGIMRDKVEKTPDLTNKYTLIPINLNSHWTLAIVMFPEYCITYLNSMGDTLEVEDQEMAWKLVNYFNTKYPVPKGGKASCWKFKAYNNIQYQTNSDDCGVFVLAWARAWLFDQQLLFYIGLDRKQMGKLRKIFQYELKEDKLMKGLFSQSFNEKHWKAMKRPCADNPESSAPENSEPKGLKRKRNVKIILSK